MENSSSAQKPQVFVIMPFLANLEDVYTDLVKEPLEEAGFEVKRADTDLNQRNILQDVVSGIADAALVVADVTGLNANVMYELGLAHALGKRTVMITQRIEELPFDLRPYRANEYSTNFKKAAELSAFLRSIGDAVLAGTADFSNPVQDYAPQAFSSTTQVSLPLTKASAPAETPPEGKGGAGEADEEPGLFEHIVRMQTANERIEEISAQIASLTDAIGSQMEVKTQKLERAAASLGDRSAGAILMIARDTAKDLDKYADDLNPHVRDLDITLSEMASGANAIARARTIDSQEEATALQEEITSIQELETSLAEASLGVGGFAEVLLDLPNMERNLTAASRKAAKVVTDASEVLAKGESEFTRARGLLEERLQEYRRRDGA